MQDFQSLCQNRRSIRKYTTQAVEQEKIDYILRCALMSPSSKRTNPWEFVVVRDEAKLRAMENCRTYGSGMFQTATAAIVVTLDSTLTDMWMYLTSQHMKHMLSRALTLQIALFMLRTEPIFCPLMKRITTASALAM